MDRNEREALWIEMYTKDGNIVRDLILKHESDYDIVDDLTQETFMEAWKCLDDWDEKAEFTTWVGGIAKYVVGHHLERVTAEKRANEVLEGYIDPVNYDEEDGGGTVPYYDRTDLSAAQADACDHLDPYYQYEAEQSAEYAFDRLPGATKYPMRLRAEGFSNAEIAEMLDLSVSYVENLISRARKSLAEGENLEVNRTNSIQGERDERPVERFASQADVERAQRERFLRRESAFLKRAVRHANPDATVAQWKELY